MSEARISHVYLPVSSNLQEYVLLSSKIDKHTCSSVSHRNGKTARRTFLWRHFMCIMEYLGILLVIQMFTSNYITVMNTE